VTETVIIVGQGYVGLPLTMRAVEAGYDVIGYDVDEARTKALADGTSFVEDISDTEVQAALATGRYKPVATLDGIERFDIAVITVPTPLHEGVPDLTFIDVAGEQLAPLLTKGATVVLESTTYPGSTEERLAPILEAGSGLSAGTDFHLGYSPERIDPGNKTFTLANTPKVVSGIDEASLAKVQGFYDRIVETTVPVSSPKEAELTKLLENTFRSVNIGLVNEMAIVCDKLGVNVWEVIDAAATKPFGFMRFTPGPGIGGHCIPLDPHYLAWKMRTLNYKTRFIDLASEINSDMPRYVVEKVADALNDERKAVNGSRVLVLGIAYKKDIDDMRESPALDVIRLLEELGADVVYHDPYVPSFQEDGIRHEGVQLTDAELDRADAVVIVTDHGSVDYQRVVNRAKLVVDTRNATGRATPGRARIVPLSSSTLTNDAKADRAATAARPVEA